MSTSGKPWAGVVRVSHMGVRKPGAPNVHTDREQVDELRGYAERIGVTLDLLPAELDVSGGLPLERRPSLLKAVEGVEAELYDGVIVAYLSRLGRNVREQLRVWDRVEAAGGRIVVVRENIDTSTPNGRYVRTILLANAERELEEHTERFENLRQWATQAGIWQRRQTPRGYRRDPGTRKLVPDDQADQVRGAFRRRAAGASITQLSRDLAMTQSGARALLRNRVYLGELSVGVHTNTDAHPQIVTDEEWLAVQPLRAPARPSKSGRPVALLAGLIRCASCGFVMRRGSGGGKHLIYACHRDHSAGRCPRPAGITQPTLDDHVTGLALAELSYLRTRALEGDADMADAREAVKAAEDEMAAFLEGVSAAGLAPGDYARGAAQRRERLDAAREALAILLARRPDAIDVDPHTAWAQMNAEQRNRQLRSLIECVLVAPAGRGRRVPVGQRTRLIKLGTGLINPYSRRGVSAPIRTIALPDLDNPAVLGMELSKDLLKGRCC